MRITQSITGYAANALRFTHCYLFLVFLLSLIFPGLLPSGISLGLDAHAQSQKLDALNDEIRLRQQKKKNLTDRAASLKRQRQTMQNRVITLARDLQNIDTERDRLEARLSELAVTESQLDANLQQDRVTLSRLLAGLQTLQIESPPAFAVHPEDALQAVQGAIVLASVVPSLQTRSDRLRDLLTELTTIRRRMDLQSAELIEAEKDAAAARVGLRAALTEKEKSEQAARKAAAHEARAIARLVREARSLKDLTRKLRRRAAKREKKSPDFVPPPSRFAKARGRVPMPVSGRLAARFGQKNALGQRQLGIYIEARPGAQITAPHGGRVLYSGAFRQYGGIIILAVEDRYQMVLAGLENTHAYVGQQILTGEPVGTLQAENSSLGSGSSGRSQLYMELRFDGQPIDPAPWLKTSG